MGARRITSGPHLTRASRGTAALEFALIAPVLLLVILGISDIAMTVTAKFKSSNATASATDLTAQAANLQASDMADIYAGAASVIAPLPSTNLIFRITSIASNGSGGAFVHWSCGQGALPPTTALGPVTKLANGDDISHALNLSNYSSGGYTYNGTNTSLIQVESQYGYSPPAQFVLTGQILLTATFFVLPRQASYVGFPWDGNVNDQPTPPASATHVASVTLSNGAICSYAY